MSARRPAGTRMAAWALAVVLPACGSGDGEPTTPTTPTRTQIGGGTFNVVGTVEAIEQGYNADIAAGSFPIGEGGTVEILADWTSPGNNIDIFFYIGACTSEQARSNVCAISNRTTSTTTKPERLNIIGVPAGNYSLGFANFGTTAESGSFQVFLTR